MFVIVWVLWETPIVYPIKIFVVTLHELGHALAAIVTGGEVLAIQIFPDQGGLTLTRGGSELIILSAGYLGSVLAGGLLLYASSYPGWGRVLMTLLALLIAFTTLLFIRNAFGLIFGILVCAAMLFSAARLSDRVNYYILRFVAAASCLYALLDIRGDLFNPYAEQLASFGVVNDAIALERATGISSGIWALLWMAISVVMLFYFLRLSAGIGHEDPRGSGRSLGP
jgi:hypothetical protein